jgi:cellulose synthase/poly-beta-1,6-N-acetylglucosamine synthase-like glycosyltransferase
MGEITREEGRRTEPALRQTTPLLTVILPVHNEVRTIDELLRRVLATPYEKQVIVVDDGSTDGTAEVLEKWEGHPQVELLSHRKNRGKGGSHPHGPRTCPRPLYDHPGRGPGV